MTKFLGQFFLFSRSVCLCLCLCPLKSLLIPILIKVSSVSEAIRFIRSRDKPLALYIFSKDQTTIDKVPYRALPHYRALPLIPSIERLAPVCFKVLRETSSGGAAINDVVMQATATAQQRLRSVLHQSNAVLCTGCMPGFAVWWCWCIRHWRIQRLVHFRYFFTSTIGIICPLPSAIY